MPRKAYTADLKALGSDCTAHGVQNVRSGGDDNEFCFDVNLPGVQKAVKVTGMVLPGMESSLCNVLPGGLYSQYVD